MNAAFTRDWPGVGRCLPSVADMTPRPLLIAAPLAAVLLASACSGTSAPTPAAGSTSSSPSSSPSSTSAPSGTTSAVAPSTSATSSTSPTSSAPASSAGSSQQPVAAESNPPGDIPDNVAFVPYTSTTGHYAFTHPEGWLQQVTGAQVLFTDKLNGVQVRPGTATSAPTVSSAKARSVPALARSEAAFELRSVAPASVPGGTGVLIVYRRNSAPDQVTGRQYRDEVQRYELVKGGHEVVVELFGPVGADNVDAYRTMITGLKQQ